MKGLLLDTHAAIWSVTRDQRLSKRASDEIAAAEAGGLPILISSISIVEAVYLIERSRIEAASLPALLALIDDPDYLCKLIPIDQEIATTLARVPRVLVPDMPDRILAATALAHGVPLLTKDAKLRAFEGIETIW